MLSKKVDATLGAFWNYEGVDLARRGRKPVILRMEKLGVPTYNELILVARRESLDAAGSSRLRRFITATAAGNRLVRDNPTVGVDALLAGRQGPGPRPAGGGDQGDAARSSSRPTPTSPGATRSRSTGPTTSAGCARTSCSREPPSEAPPLTNEFLPGRGAWGTSVARMR